MIGSATAVGRIWYRSYQNDEKKSRTKLIGSKQTTLIKYISFCFLFCFFRLFAHLVFRWWSNDVVFFSLILTYYYMWNIFERWFEQQHCINSLYFLNWLLHHVVGGTNNWTPCILISSHFYWFYKGTVSLSLHFDMTWTKRILFSFHQNMFLFIIRQHESRSIQITWVFDLKTQLAISLI